MSLSCFAYRLVCVASVASRLEPGYCDLNEYYGKPLPAAGGESLIWANASNLKTWFLAKKQTNKQKNLYDCKLVMLLLTFTKKEYFP